MKKGTKKRSHQVILYNRRTIAKNYLKGKSQIEIGALINLSHNMVGQELEALRRQWVMSSEIDFAEAQGEALHKVNDMEQEAINQYQKSKRAKKIITRKREPVTVADTENPEIDDAGNIVSPTKREFVMVEESIRTEEGTSDVRWHDQILKCIDMRLKILGLYKQPIKEGFDGRLEAVSITKETTKGKAALFLAVFEEWDETRTNN